MTADQYEYNHRQEAASHNYRKWDQPDAQVGHADRYAGLTQSYELPESPKPAVGQIWGDADPRVIGRKVLITEIARAHAKVYDGKRFTRVRLDRLNGSSRGYRFLKATI